MSLNVVGVECAKALRKLGYPQEDFPQAGYLNFAGAKDADDWRGPLLIQPKVMKDKAFLAAPDLIAALDWLEKEKGWFWQRWNDGAIGFAAVE